MKTSASIDSDCMFKNETARSKNKRRLIDNENPRNLIQTIPTNISNMQRALQPSKNSTNAVERALTKRRMENKRLGDEKRLSTMSVKFMSGMLVKNEAVQRKQLTTQKPVDETRFEANRRVDTNDACTNLLLNPENSITVRRFSQQQMMPLGGVLGERAAKSILIFRKPKLERTKSSESDVKGNFLNSENNQRIQSKNGK